MHIEFFTLSPRLFVSPLESDIFQRARDKGIVNFRVHNIRDYTHDRHHVTDDYPYGGGAGMVLKPEPVFEAVEAVLAAHTVAERHAIILMTPQGRPFSQATASRLAGCDTLFFLCGRYEGVDERIRINLATEEISLGDYVLSGGEFPALAVADAVVRLIPGVLGSAESICEESHAAGLLEYPQYTRPPEFRGLKVPEVLLSGHHGEVARWRRRESLRRTLVRRPELLREISLSPGDIAMVSEIQAEELTAKKSTLSQV